MAKIQQPGVWREITNTKNSRAKNIEISIINLMLEANLPATAELNRLRTLYGITNENNKTIIDNTQWIGAKRETTKNRLTKQIMPILRRRDNYIQRAIQNEWTISYFQQAYYTDNVIIGELLSAGVRGVYSSALAPPDSRALSRAIKNLPLTIPEKYKQVRGEFVSNVFATIERGVNAGSTVSEIAKQIDQQYGFRDSSGKLVISKDTKIPFVGGTDRKPMAVNPRIPTGGQTYNSVRIVRTEMSMMQSDAAISALAESQALGVDEKLMKLATLDNRTRQQSAEMDGKLSRNDGKFKYPNGNYYYRGQTGIAKWDINDRGDTAPYIEGFGPTFRRERVVKTGKNKVVKYKSFSDYAKKYGLKKSIYGEKYYG